MSKKEERSPYYPFSVDDVMAAEVGTYYIQIGTEIFSSETGKMAFNKERADHFYRTILAGLNDMKNNGNEQEREDAMQCLMFLNIYPLRIH